jgi:hypothetical protein
MVMARNAAVVSLSFTPAAGRPKNTKNSWTMNGVLRMSST